MIEAHHVLKQEPARHGVHGRKDEDDRFSRRLEEHVKQDKDLDRKRSAREHQALPCAQLELVLSRPPQRVSGRQMQLPIEHALRVVNIAADLFCGRECGPRRCSEVWPDGR
jgi:hypothetical protein